MALDFCVANNDFLFQALKRMKKELFNDVQQSRHSVQHMWQ